VAGTGISAGLLSLLPGGGGSLLSTLYGFGTTQGGASTRSDPLLALRLAQTNRTRELATTAREPEIARDVRAFREAVAKATTPEEALANPAVLKVLLTANGLADQVPYTALAKRVLLSDPADGNSLVNKLANTRWTSAVKSMEFATKGLDVLRDPQVLTTLADGFVEVSWRKALEKSTPGLSDALDFRERAASFTSALGILGDPVLRRVVTTTLGIPKEIAFQELNAQERAITTRLDVKRLQEPRFVDIFSQRYLLEAQKSAAQGTASDLISLAVQSRSFFA